MWKISNPKSNFFSQKFFNPPMRPKRHFALKDTFPMETIVKKKVQNSQNFQNFAKLFSKKNKIEEKKIEKKYIFFPRRLRRLGIIFFFGACGASFFFFSTGKRISLGKSEKKIEKKSQVHQNRGDQTCKFPHSWNVTPP